MEKFDSKTHKFGMAYFDNLTQGHVVYPVRRSMHEADDVMCISVAGMDIGPYEFAELRRAPQFDLVDASSVQKLKDEIGRWAFHAGQADGTALRLGAAVEMMADVLLQVVPVIEDAQADPVYKAGAMAELKKKVLAAAARADDATISDFWLDISTAPQDGSPVICWCDGSISEMVYIDAELLWRDVATGLWRHKPSHWAPAMPKPKIKK